MEWAEYLIAIITGLIVTVPLVIKLIEYVKKATKEKNWGQLLNFVLDLMQQAEELFETGAERKKWVVSMVESSAKSLNYDIDIKQVDKMVDGLCKMSKKVNKPKNLPSICKK